MRVMTSRAIAVAAAAAIALTAATLPASAGGGYYHRNNDAAAAAAVIAAFGTMAAIIASSQHRRAHHHHHGWPPSPWAPSQHHGHASPPPPSPSSLGMMLRCVSRRRPAHDRKAAPALGKIAQRLRRSTFGRVNTLFSLCGVILVRHERFARSTLCGGDRRQGRRSRHLADGEALARRPRQDGQEARRGSGRGRDRRHAPARTRRWSRKAPTSCTISPCSGSPPASSRRMSGPRWPGASACSGSPRSCPSARTPSRAARSSRSTARPQAPALQSLQVRICRSDKLARLPLPWGRAG